MAKPRPTRVLLMLPLSPPRRSWSFEVPDLGLLSLATALDSTFGTKVETTVRVKNLALDDDAFLSFLNEGAFDLVGIKVMSSSFGEARRTVLLARAALPQARVVVGGPHVTAMAQQALEQLKADYAVNGEGEEALVELVRLQMRGVSNNGRLKRVPGLVWREAGQVRTNARAVLGDIDRYGVPAWTHMNPQLFSPLQTRASRLHPAAPIVLTRGCSARCAFCSAAGSSFRTRSTTIVMEELAILRERYGVREFQVLDDNCAQDRGFLMEFCDEFIRSGVNMPWRIPGGVCVRSIGSAEMLERLRKSGCYQLWLGIESGSDRILRSMRKGITVRQVRDVVGMVKKSGIDVGGFFILGYPGETRGDRAQTMELALSLPLDYAKFTIFIPQPGSEIFARLRESRQLTDIERVLDRGDNDFQNDLTDISPEALKRQHQQFSLRFYLRPRVVLKFLSEYGSPAQALFLLNYARQFVFYRHSQW